MEIKSDDSVKYLGVRYDNNMQDNPKNIGGPGSNSRILLCTVAYSKLLYGALVWREIWGIRNTRRW